MTIIETEVVEIEVITLSTPIETTMDKAYRECDVCGGVIQEAPEPYCLNCERNAPLNLEWD